MALQNPELQDAEDLRTGYLLVVKKVGPFKNHTEGTLSNLLAHTVVHPHDIAR